jgi:OmcA/MtrC family decaheme c-type cytochrome
VAAGTDIRDVVSINKCNECHDKLAFHGGGRVEARYCVVCHTDQRKFGYAEATTTATGYNPDEVLPDNTASRPSTGQRKINGGAVGDMTAMAHRIHMGTNLGRTGYQYAGVYFDKLGYSMLDGGQRMCIKCHSNVPQADNWKTKPTRLACGTCHDSVDFAVGHGTGVPAITNDTTCALCHLPADISTYHLTSNLTKHNPTVAAGLTNFTYEISSATQATSGGPVTIKFRIMQSTDGSTATPVTFLAATTPMANPLTGFTGSPSFQLAYSLPQDGISAPSDFNNIGARSTSNGTLNSNFQPISFSIANLLDTTKNLTVGTLSAPDASGYYTATVVGANAIFPADAKLRQVGLQGYFTQVAPAAARHAISVVKTVTGDTTRRAVIDNNKCANCHEWFEGHGGNRVYSVQICVQCHVPGLVTSGKGLTDAALSTYYPKFTADENATLTTWTGVDFSVNPVTAGGTNVALAFPQTSNNMKDMIHGIHAGKDRTSPIKIVRDRTPNAVNVINGGAIGFPGILNNCASCHTYNGYNVPTSGALLPTREEAVNVAGNTTTALAKAALATSNTTDRMITPFTAACVSCHDSTAAQAHMTLNGGQIKVLRSDLNIAGESCAVCHGAGSDFDPVKVH